MREIAATKAYTIGRRGAYKDYIDLYFILSQQHAMLTDIIDVAEKKFGFEFNSRLFLEQLVFLDDVEDKSAVTRARLLGFFRSEHSYRQRFWWSFCESIELSKCTSMAATAERQLGTKLRSSALVAASLQRRWLMKAVLPLFFTGLLGLGGRGRIGADRARRSCGQPDDSRERFVAARCVAPRGHARRKRSRRP